MSETFSGKPGPCQTELSFTEILARARDLCRKDGIDWLETSASESSDYIRQAERELRASSSTQGSGKYE